MLLIQSTRTSSLRVRDGAISSTRCAISGPTRSNFKVHLSSTCRAMLPKARDQKASSTGSDTEQPLQLPTTMPGTRVVSAEQRKPDQGGLFKDTGLTRSKDTGGVGTAHPYPTSAGLLDISGTIPKHHSSHA